MELRQIYCFLAVADELHFGKAAEKLRVAQSSVSEAIQSLEREVGGLMFIRTSRRVRLTPLGERFRTGMEPAALMMRGTVEDCRRLATGEAHRIKIGLFGGGLYELTLPFVARLKTRYGIGVEWVELSLLDQFDAVANGTVDVAFCRLPLARDGLVQGAVMLSDPRKLAVPINHRLAAHELIDPEELANEAVPRLPTGHQLGPWAATHFPSFTPAGKAIKPGPTVRTVRECLAVVEAGEALAIMSTRAEMYYSVPGVKFVAIDIPPVETALVRRHSDRRRMVLDAERCASEVASLGLDRDAGQRQVG
jgi:DNA-binding transcriptional LysR family regulator